MKTFLDKFPCMDQYEIGSLNEWIHKMSVARLLRVALQDMNGSVHSDPVITARVLCLFHNN